jgi:cell wall-associated NlpC family hydrolase
MQTPIELGDVRFQGKTFPLPKDKRRSAVVLEALSWTGTPYLLRGRIKGVGCDCVTLLAEAMIAAGVYTRESINEAFRQAGLYTDDWFHHAKSEKYLAGLMKFGRLIAETKCFASVKASPGNLVMTRCVRSKRFNHGGIVIAWPYVVHAVTNTHVSMADASRHPLWVRHDIAIFDPFGEGE